MRWFVVEVVAVPDWEDLDPEDVDAEGNCIVDGCYLIRAADEAAALTRFHDKVPITCLDDFLITIRRRRPADDLASFYEIA
ncbi:hypothetical protein [Paracoccus sp. FO-3]|uniref:hypothetical protein n=1 Tax=Paracoccus sp. FO-3 TaxID=1335059 RepID=UPI001125B7C8|nr:hypothetical protein [Paracoccus sp. FO-3]